MTLLEDSSTSPSDERDFSQTDFCDPRIFDDPGELYAWLRAQPTLVRDEPNNLYVAARHEDVFTISRDPETYCNRFGVRPVIAGDMSIITLDGEEHIRTRRLINQGFTPRRVRDLIPHVRQLTNEIIDTMTERVQAKAAEDGQDVEQVTVDFVQDFAIHVPLIIICELMGLDPQQRLSMYAWSDAMMAGDGHIEADDPILHAAAGAFGEYAMMCLDLIAERRADPKDDIISILTQAFDAGDLTKEHKALQGITKEELEEREHHSTLNDDELLAFLAVLLVAGNETTRNAISGGLVALSRFPDQKKLMLDNLWDDEFMDRAVDELIRYVTPVLSFIRTVTHDHTYRGTDLVEGDRVLMLYGSANRDETVFERPDELDFTRESNPHLAFGIGPHFCLGANLARMEVKTVFQELLSRLPDIDVPEGLTPGRGDSTLVIALEDIPATYSGSGCPVAH
ncbi:cytochrome P450 [Dermatobacter hominis]|uniref:cytochrome P450 n=1 Tax=Dermatobacter hominis TaxID=2884263 RepID=UPI001D117898|nr:cytochrome P450 [Dermatobacter hominis]UDY34668.1 cytochrome P450 [Dermatobacter hominis]